MSDSGFYNVLDPHIDDEKEVLKMRETAIKLYRKGIRVMEWGGEGTNAKRQFTAKVEDVLRETRYFLKQKNPCRWGRIIRQSTVIRLR